MAGKGFPPNPDRSRVARRNKDVLPFRVIQRDPMPQPSLPGSIDWHMQTLLWWETWGNDELAAEFTGLEWNYLTETAVLVDAFWRGNMTVAGELRLRAAKFGVTPEDRARLRIQVTTAQDIEEKSAARKNQPGSRERYQRPESA